MSSRAYFGPGGADGRPPSADDIDADLQAWLRFYNFERPHCCYRTKGRRPAATFYAERPALLVMKGWDIDELTPQSVRP
jgi:hypothetical protein